MPALSDLMVLLGQRADSTPDGSCHSIASSCPGDAGTFQMKFA